MSKLIVNFYRSFGKNDSMDLVESFLISSPEELKDYILENFYSDDENQLFEDIKEVFNKRKGWVSILNFGDYDDPTSFDFEITTYEVEKAKITEEYQKRLNQLEELFKE